jgi:hypothetical protein
MMEWGDRKGDALCHPFNLSYAGRIFMRGVMKTSKLLAASIFSFSALCTASLGQDADKDKAKQTVMKCAAGLSNDAKGGLSAKIDKSNYNGDLTAEYGTLVYGAILADPKLSGDQKLEAYKLYLDCIKSQ